jgi:uncharacterized protein (TIGR03067 family)
VGSAVKAAVVVTTGQALASDLVPASVVSLVEGANSAMMLTKYKPVVFLLISAVLVSLGGLGVWTLGAWRSGPVPAQHVEVNTVVAAELEGQWRCVAFEEQGKPAPHWLVGAQRVTVTIVGDTLSAPRLFVAGSSFSLPASPANAIDIRVQFPKGESYRVPGIYARHGDHLRLCLPLAKPNSTRPTRFKTRPGDGCTTFEFEKVTPELLRRVALSDQLGAILEEAQTHQLLATDRERLASRCLKLAEAHAGTEEAVVSLLFALANTPESPAGKAALALLKAGRLIEADLETLARCFGVHCGDIGPGSIPEKINQELAPLLLERVRRTPDHPKAAEVLSSVCALSSFRQRPWAGRYEPVVRSIQAQNPDNYIRYRAAFTLAQLVAEAGEARLEEARELYIRFVKDCRPKSVDQSVTHLVERLVEEARREIDGMIIRGVGGQTPPLEGVDLDGKPMDLDDFRGKVVLLSFWATWCGPCMNLNPHERALHERYKGRPFAMVGVNGDEIGKLNRRLLETNPVPWRSFQDRRSGQKMIRVEWNIAAWPTLFLIDHTGKIRRRWIGTPPRDELDHEVERWVAAAEGKPLAPPLSRLTAAVGATVGKGLPAKFLDRVYTDQSGRGSKYAICVPENHDPKMPLPVILFLHGSGQVGTDNRKQLEIGLGPAIRKNGMPFAFIGVFPQAHVQNWLAARADGKRALAILEEVEREFATDKKRVYLTGVRDEGGLAPHGFRHGRWVLDCGCPLVTPEQLLPGRRAVLV